MTLISNDIEEAISLNQINRVTTWLNTASLQSDETYEQLVKLAASYGHVEILKLFLSDSRFNCFSNNNMALQWAVQSNRVNVVDTFISDPRLPINSGYTYSIHVAACRGYLDILTKLLSISDNFPTIDKRATINLAIEYGHYREAKVLLSDSRIVANLTPSYVKQNLNTIERNLHE